MFGTIGTPSFGTVKIGRDIGLFASDAILNDLTLFGVGTPLNNFAPTNVQRLAGLELATSTPTSFRRSLIRAQHGPA